MPSYDNLPGTALGVVIPKWITQNRKGCGCKDYAKKMDQWGWEKCSGEKREDIIKHLVNQSDNLTGLAKAMPARAKEIAAAGMLSIALKMSKPSDDSSSH